MLTHLDDSTRELVRLAALLAGGTEDDVRRQLTLASTATPHEWIEELLLQTYLFAGFPRALNGMREWRRISPTPASGDSASAPASVSKLRAEGEATCARVYGSMYDRLRTNVRELHPLLDEWMILEGYGKVLSRPGLSLERRELCIVAACAASGQDRQLQSHFHGARNVGVPEDVIAQTLLALQGIVPEPALARATRLWNRIRNDIH
jgi:4-carboxymuconolactone decarboxylase